MTALRIAQIQLNVGRLDLAVAFYRALGFTLVDGAVMRRGAQEILLQVPGPPGAPYPADATACDQSFQHFALPVDAVVPPDAVAISAGPQRLPQRSGGATCYKFRDPDGHPLELIRFPDGHAGGIDHTAIVVADVERSIAFYQALGFRLGARQTNTGVEQDRLDGLSGVVVDVVALYPAMGGLHLELLGYRSPPVRPAAWGPSDIAATRLVIETDKPGPDVLQRDPDGHLLILRYNPGATPP